MSHLKRTNGSRAKRSILETDPAAAWAILAKLENESPGGMTALPVLRPGLSKDERQALNRHAEEAGQVHRTAP